MSLNFEERKAVVTYRVEKAAKTHEGIIRIFGLEYVKKGRVLWRWVNYITSSSPCALLVTITTITVWKSKMFFRFYSLP